MAPAAPLPEPMLVRSGSSRRVGSAFKSDVRGSNVVIDDFGINAVTSATVADQDWVDKHVKKKGGKTVIEVKGKDRVLPHADVSDLTPESPKH